MSALIRSREGFQRETARLPPVERNYPVRLTPEARIFLAVLDDVAGVCFPTPEGKVDMESMLLLSDSAGHRWAQDLFTQLWNQAREWLGPQTPPLPTKVVPEPTHPSNLAPSTPPQRP